VRALAGSLRLRRFGFTCCLFGWFTPVLHYFTVHSLASINAYQFFREYTPPVQPPSMKAGRHSSRPLFHRPPLLNNNTVVSPRHRPPEQARTSVTRNGLPRPPSLSQFRRSSLFTPAHVFMAHRHYRHVHIPFAQPRQPLIVNAISAARSP